MNVCNVKEKSQDSFCPRSCYPTWIFGVELPTKCTNLLHCTDIYIESKPAPALLCAKAIPNHILALVCLDFCPFP